MNILVVFIVLLVACNLYRGRFTQGVIMDYVIGRRSYYKKKMRTKWTFEQMRKYLKNNERILLFLSLLFAIYVLLMNYSSYFHELTVAILHNIKFFTKDYPMITTVVGAFIALWCIYLLVHVKAYVCPIVLYSHTSNDNRHRYYNWFIENRSIFDTVNIDASVYKCTRLGGHGVTYKELKLACDHLENMTGRWSEGNKICVKLQQQQLKLQDVVDGTFDFLEINSSFVHALSNVITVESIRYKVNDIYYAKLMSDKIITDRPPLPKVELNTLRMRMQKRFMYARKYVTYTIVLILLLFLCEAMGLYKTNFLNDMGHWFQEGLAYVLIVFASIRYTMQLQVDSTITDFPYRHYRVCYKK